MTDPHELATALVWVIEWSNDNGDTWMVCRDHYQPRTPHNYTTRKEAADDIKYRRQIGNASKHVKYRVRRVEMVIRERPWKW